MRKALWVILAVLVVAVVAPLAHAQSLYVYTYTLTGTNGFDVTWTTKPMPAVTGTTIISAANLASFTVTGSQWNNGYWTFDQAVLDASGQDQAKFIGPPPGYLAAIFNSGESLPLADYSTPGLYVTPGSIEVLDDCPGSACSELVSGTESLNVTAFTSCGVSLTPTSEPFPSSGGLGNFAVSTGPNCNLRAATNDSWIALFPGVFVCAPTLPSCPAPPAGAGNVRFSVAANSTGVARTGSISVGNQNFNVTQNAVGSTCRISVGPLQDTLTETGGNFHVNVTILDGSNCRWTAVSNTNWLSVTSAASGSGSASVSVHAARNTGAPRSGTLTIAGATVSVTEGTGPCGAVDITSQVGINEGTLNFIWSGTFSQSIAVTNNTGSVIPGPVFLVTLGEPTNYGYPYDSGLEGGGPVTRCFSPNGDYLILASNGLQPGQSVGVPLVWFTQTFNPGVRYTIKALSGLPNK